MNSEIITTDSNNDFHGKKVLFIPDSIWGDLSGHRSSKYLVKAFNEIGVKVGVYASKENYTIEQERKLGDCNTYYEQSTYSYIQNIFPFAIAREFKKVIKAFNPDYVFYMGSINTKVTINVCRKLGIPYSYLPLTTEYYCVKNFAGLENGPCFQCIKSPVLSPFKNKCLGARFNLPKYLKEIIFSIKSKKRILKANKIIGYSENQLSYLKKFGVNGSKMMTMPIFFDPETIKGIATSQGDYFVMAGQNITAKGWHVLPDIIKKGKNIKYKLIMRDKNQAKAFVENNGLNEYVKNGFIDIVLYLKTHREVLDVIAKSRGVLVPSYYATTGEFYLVEALGLGKPVIVFDAGIHGEIIKNGENGMISQVGDLDNFYKNIQKVNDNDDLLRRLSQGAKVLFHELLSLTKFKNSINKYFQ